MPSKVTKLVASALILGAGLALSGCVVSNLHLSDDFGGTLKQDVVAQVADPDARYKGAPAPGAAGHRAALAQDRYNHNAVIMPAATSTSTVSIGGGGGGGGGTSQ